GDAGWSESVQVGAFVLAVLEVRCLDVAFVQQGFEAVVDLADADAEFPGQCALGGCGIVGKMAQDQVVRFVVEGLFGHWASVCVPVVVLKYRLSGSTFRLIPTYSMFSC